MCLSEIDSAVNLFQKIFYFLINIPKKTKAETNVDALRKNQSQFPYHFEDYTKHITIYKNGNGIIINSANLIVTDIKRFDKVYRKLNIEDGKKTSNFPALEDMLKLDKNERFEKFGFWYDSDDKIISGIKEFYWSDTDKTKEDKRLKNNPKELRWYFDFNTSQIEENKPYKIIYVISIEGMYPLTNGIFDNQINNDPNAEDINESSIEIMQDIKNFKYIVSFEDGIHLKKAPKCEICGKEHLYSNNIIVSDEKDYNILFEKHNFVISKPILGSNIKVSWEFSHNVEGEENHHG